MATFRTERNSRRSFYLGAICDYCERQNISQDDLEVQPTRQFSDREIEVVTDVYNNEKSAAMLQDILEVIESIMEKVNRGVSSTAIWFMCNPYDKSDCCLGYIDESLVKVG